MQPSTVDAIDTIMSTPNASVDLAQTVSSVENGEVVNTAIGMGQVADGLAGMFGKSLPGGPLPDAAGFGWGLYTLAREYNGEVPGIPAGTVQVSTVCSAASDLAGLAGVAALAVAGVAALPVVAIGGTVVAGTAAASATAWAVVGMVALAGSVALGIAALQDGTVDVQAVFEEIELAANRLREALGETYDEVKSLVLDILGFAGNAIDSVVDAFVDAINNPVGVLGKLLDLLIPPAYGDEINLNTKTNFDSAQRVTPPRRDPLVLDLDADGLETTGLNATNPVLFDHDADGIKTGTGWVSAHDAFLVLDRNGNGVIDNGRELFGDSTLLANGSAAADGFAALQEQDTNADGVVNASDTNFANLRLWQDLNQDGISQSNELFTLAALIPIPSPTSGRRERAEARSARVCSTGIASINVAATDHSRTRATCYKSDTEIPHLHKLAA